MTQPLSQALAPLAVEARPPLSRLRQTPAAASPPRSTARSEPIPTPAVGAPWPHPAANDAALREAPLRAVWAEDAATIAAAQRLRHRVFVEGMGAHIQPPAGSPDGHDIDAFDAHCAHLTVQRPGADGALRVLGTYRLLSPAGARAAGGLYSDGEFDLTTLAALRPHLVELGRSCVSPDARHGSVMLLLWSALADYMATHGLRWMLGCASIPMHDGGHQAASIWRRLSATHLADEALRVRPHHPLPLDALQQDLDVAPPPLIDSYLRCGARLLGPPAWDAAFGTADLPLLLDLKDLPGRHQRRFLKAG